MFALLCLGLGGLAAALVSTAHAKASASTTATIVDRILNVCKDLRVSCLRSGPSAWPGPFGFTFNDRMRFRSEAAAGA